MSVIAYILGENLDSESAQTAISMSFLVIASTVSTYVFGAVWQDTKGRSND